MIFWLVTLFRLSIMSLCLAWVTEFVKEKESLFCNLVEGTTAKSQAPRQLLWVPCFFFRPCVYLLCKILSRQLLFLILEVGQPSTGNVGKFVAFLRATFLGPFKGLWIYAQTLDRRRKVKVICAI